MAITDPIADMLSRIKNAVSINAETVELPSSKLKVKILEVFKKEGYIDNFEEFSKGNKKFLKIVFKIRSKNKNVIKNLKRVSSPGRHIYVGYENLPKVQSGFGTAIVSTSKGIMTDKEARQNKIGGEVLLYIW